MEVTGKITDKKLEKTVKMETHKSKESEGKRRLGAKGSEEN